jgi:pimeloyl-ACP methyl ester carboxylesterase
MAWWQWGNPAASHVVVCVHGLSRQGRDFDVLAQALCARAGDTLRVVCPDIAGRGQSDWLKDPMGYQIPYYAADMLILLQQLKAGTLDWLGTSMGGLIGMALAGQPELPFKVRKLVINDIGPAIKWIALQRIGAYLGQPVRFTSLEQAADAMWLISSSFGPHTREQWLALSRHMIKPVADAQGGFSLHYDPAISVAFGSATQETAQQGEDLLWQLYDRISASTLLIRGAQSDLLSPETAREMTQRGPRARLVEFAGVGHAPMFVAPDQVQVVSDFLLGTATAS